MLSNHPTPPLDTRPSERPLWLLSRRADFWLACGGASVGLLAAILLIFLRGDRELDAWTSYYRSSIWERPTMPSYGGVSGIIASSMCC